MESILASVVSSDCDCGIFPTQITNMSALCSSSCSNQVIYNAWVLVASDADKVVLTALLSSWVDRSTPVTVANYELVPDSNCSAAILSTVPQPECPTQRNEESQVVILYGLISMFAVAVLVLLVFAIMMVVITAKRKSYHLDFSQER